MPRFRPDVRILSGLCETLAEAVSVGLPVREVFAELRESEKGRPEEHLYAELCEYADSGEPLSECLKMTGMFPEYMVRLIAVGEITGHSEQTLSRLSAYYALQNRLNAALKTSVLYPSVLGCVLLCVLFVIATEVLPVFKGVYAQLGAALPPAAAAVFSFGEWLRSVRWVLATVLAAIAMLIAVTAAVPFLRRRAFSAVIVLFGNKVQRCRAAADLCSVLAMTCSAGVEPSRGIAMAAELADRRNASCLSAAAAAMEAGAEMSAVLKETGFFDRMDLHYIDLAIRSGNLSEVMEKLAERYGERAEEIFARRVAMVEPAAVIVLAVGVGLMLLGVMLPLLGALSVLG